MPVRSHRRATEAASRHNMMFSFVYGLGKAISQGTPMRLWELAAEVVQLFVDDGDSTELVAPPDALVATEIKPSAHILPRRVLRRRSSPREARCFSAHRDSVTVTYCPPGERLDPDTVPFPRENAWWEEAIAVATMSALFLFPFLCLFCLVMGVPALVYACLQMWVYRKDGTVATFCLLYSSLVFTLLLYFCYLGDSEVKMGLRHHWVFDCVRRHYRLRCIAPPLPYVNQKGRYLLAQFPHGVFPLAMWLHAATVGLPASGFPRPMRAAIGDVLLKLPMFKHLFQWMGCVSAEKSFLLELLQRESVGIIPEGVAGVTEGATPDLERLYILNRKGFVRVAIQAGAGIVPIYHIGNSQLMKFYGLGDFSRKARVTIGLFLGRFWLPIPKQYPMVSLIGAPIEVKQCDNPSDEYVDQIHAKVVKSLVDNYNLHRHLIPGWEDKELILA